MLQVAAIMVAGIWTWTVFQRMSAPSLETKFGVETKLNWAPTSDGKHCLADFYVTVKNQGQSPFDVDGARVRGWLVDMRKHKLLLSGEGKPAYFDPNIADPKSPGHEDPFYDGVGQPIPQDLSTHYPPGAMEDSDATFTFENSPDTLVILRVDLNGHKSNGLIPFLKPTPIDDYSYEVDQVCGAKWASKSSQAVP
jgi:hypothetical protein